MNIARFGLVPRHGGSEWLRGLRAVLGGVGSERGSFWRSFWRASGARALPLWRGTGARPRLRPAFVLTVGADRVGESHEIHRLDEVRIESRFGRDQCLRERDADYLLRVHAAAAGRPDSPPQGYRLPIETSWSATFTCC